MSILAAAALALAQSATVPLQRNPAWATFRRNPALRRMKEEVEVGTIIGRPRGEALQFWLRRNVTDRKGTIVRWTTTLACPAAREAIGSMEALSASPDVPGFGVEDDWIILDGVGYSLEAPGRIGGGGDGFRVSSNVETPLAEWVDSTLKVLEPCWTDGPTAQP